MMGWQPIETVATLGAVIVFAFGYMAWLRAIWTKSSEIVRDAAPYDDTVDLKSFADRPLARALAMAEAAGRFNEGNA